MTNDKSKPVRVLFLNIRSVTCALVLTHHESIDHWAEYGLQQQQHGANWTLVGDDAVAVANCGFCLDGEEEGRDEAVDIMDTWRPFVVLQMVKITPWGKQKEHVREFVKNKGGDRKGAFQV